MSEDREARIQEFKEFYGLDDDTEAEDILEAHLCVYERPQHVAEAINSKLERSFAEITPPISIIFRATPGLVLSVLEQLSDLELVAYQYRPEDENRNTRDMDSVTNHILGNARSVIFRGKPRIFENEKDLVIDSQTPYFLLANMFAMSSDENPLASGITATLSHNIDTLQETQILDGETRVFLVDYRDLVTKRDWTQLQSQEKTIQRETYAALVKDILDWKKYAEKIMREGKQDEVREQRMLLNRYLVTTNHTSYDDMIARVEPERNRWYQIAHNESIPIYLRPQKALRVCDFLLKIMQDPQHKPFLEQYFQ